MVIIPVSCHLHIVIIYVSKAFSDLIKRYLTENKKFTWYHT